MVQSTLYKKGSSVATDVNVTDDPSRQVGHVDVDSLNGAVDIEDDTTRNLGHVLVDAQTDVDIEAQSLGALTTDMAPALGSNGGDEVRVATPQPIDASAGVVSVEHASPLDVSSTTVPVEQQTPAALEDTQGTQVDPATDSTLQNVLTALQNEPNLDYGRTSVAASGTAEQLNGGTSISIPDGNALAIVGLRGNSGDCYFGDSNVGTGTGVPIAPGQVFTLGIDDVASVWVDADNAGDGVAWLVEVA